MENDLIQLGRDVVEVRSRTDFGADFLANACLAKEGFSFAHCAAALTDSNAKLSSNAYRQTEIAR